MNKVLIVTYYWPPSGGAGVQRWLKFSKYLPEFGWEPIILTVDPEYAAYPVTDFSLKDDLPSSVKVYSTPAINYFSIYKKDTSKIPSAGFANSVDNTFKGKFLRFLRGNLFIPDPRRGWNKYAFQKACELIEMERITNIITTSPPHSTQLIGLKIKKKFPLIRWIADLRDPWTDIYYYDQFYPAFLSRWIDSGYERNVIRKADSIITVGESLKRLFTAKVPEAEAKAVVISNGFDEEDFEGEVKIPKKFTITYTGSLSDVYPLDGFLEALTGLKSEFLLRFVGSVSQKQRDLILSKLNKGSIEFLPYTDHQMAIRHMRESSALLLIIPDHPSNRTILTGKIFEYLASGKPVICLGPEDGDATSIIRETVHGKAFAYNDSDAIGSYLNELYSSESSLMSVSLQFSRKELTARLVRLLQQKTG